MYQPCMESVNYSGNPSCDEQMYQPYMECQKINLVIVHVMNIHLEAFVSYLVLTWFLKCKLCECMTLVPLIHILLYIDVCENNTRTILIASMGLVQAHPNKVILVNVHYTDTTWIIQYTDIVLNYSVTAHSRLNCPMMLLAWSV